MGAPDRPGRATSKGTAAKHPGNRAAAPTQATGKNRLKYSRRAGRPGDREKAAPSSPSGAAYPYRKNRNFKKMDQHEIVKRAQAVSKATGVSFSKAYRAIVENPEPVRQPGAKPAAVNSDFMKLVCDYRDKYHCDYKTAYLATRKAHEDVFERWLEMQQA